MSQTSNGYSYRWRSIRILYFTSALTSIGYSISITSIWPFLKVLDPTVETTFLGFAISAYSVGQFISSPFLGWLSSHLNNTAPSLYVGLVLQLTGYLLWTFLQDLPHGQYFMIVARTLVGFGSGLSASVRSFIPKATTLSERTAAIGKVSACQAFGFAIGPAVQAVFVPVGFPGPLEKPIHLNIYTCPAWFSVATNTLNIVVVKCFFREYDIADDPEIEEPAERRTVNQPFANDEPEEVDEVVVQTDEEPIAVVSTIDYYIVLILLLVIFIVFFVFIIFETIATPLAIFEYGWKKSKAMVVNGMIWSALGLFGVVFSLTISRLSKWVKERYLLIFGYVVLVVSLFVYLPMAGPKPPIDWSNSSFITNSSSTDSGGGCPWKLKWCFTLPSISIYQMVVATCMMGFSFSVTNVIGSSLYSKTLGAIPQGLWMGVFTAVGSLARLLGPVYAGAMLFFYGPLVTLGCVGAMSVPGLILLIVFFRRIAPSPEYPQRLEGRPQS